MKKITALLSAGIILISCGQSSSEKKATPADSTAAPAKDSVPITVKPHADEDTGVALGVSDLGNGLSKFTGAWFDIKYPSSFTVRPSQKSTSSDGYESVFFESPDHTVEFYVFSPQWSGDSKDIAFNPQTENKVADEVSKGTDEKLHYFTYEAKDKSYTRSYQESTENEGSVRWVVGIKYKDMASYNKYKTDYINFKKSMMQYAD